METENKIIKKGRSRQEKEELLSQWKQSGKSRKEFCQEQGINYGTFVTWPHEYNRKVKAGFKEVKLVQPAPSLFAQVYFPSGIRVDIFQQFSSDYFRSLK